MGGVYAFAAMAVGPAEIDFGSRAFSVVATEVSKDYRITIWKTIPNAEHKNLKFLLPYF